MYFQIKTLDVERVDIERSEGDMQHHRIAATSFELEAERRREVIAADRRFGRRLGLAHLVARLRARGTSGGHVLPDRRVRSGKLGQRRA